MAVNGAPFTNGDSSPSDNSGLSGLQNDKSVRRLEQISSLRARGIQNAIDLPQLVVCGDQSAGKSSVLEGITSIPFPRADGVCTKFATEVILEHSEQERSITASILPHASRDTLMRVKLQGFHAALKDYDELPDVIARAGELMGLKGYGRNTHGPGFAEDVLRIRVIGRTGLHLSIVDLPGLIAFESDEQTKEDVQTVHRMVNTYIEKQRTIVLAVVQATNDIANQSIIKKSREFDPTGKRTVGLLTKADLINKGTESRIAALAKNLDSTRLRLGFFLLKNPTPEEMAQSITPVQRSANERHFFMSGAWREQKLDAERVGIDKLRDFLQRLLSQHIEEELPKVREEIRAMVRTTQRDLDSLPMERPSIANLRMYLSSLAMQFHNLSVAALNGDYHTSFAEFFTTEGDEVGSTRLRALVHQANSDFAAHMREKGATMKQAKPASKPAAKVLLPPPFAFGTGPLGPKTSPFAIVAKEIPSSPTSDSYTTSEAGMKDWVKQTYLKTRGRELPGNTSSNLLTELFHHQSRKWSDIAADHVADVCDLIETFVKMALKHINMEDYVRDELEEFIKVKLMENRKQAERELKQICADEQAQPITYNHYYSDNVQASRTGSIEKMMSNAMDNISAENPGAHMSWDAIKAALKNNIIVDMDEQACSEALADLNAYYKVAMKTFVDNLCRQCVERHLIRGLPNILTPHDIAGYSDEELKRVAGERYDVAAERKHLNQQLEMLTQGLEDLRK